MAKAMKWSNSHTDKYIFEDGKWVKVACTLNDGKAGMNCTAPETLPRGTKFNYNCRLTTAEEYRVE